MLYFFSFKSNQNAFTFERRIKVLKYRTPSFDYWLIDFCSFFVAFENISLITEVTLFNELD